MAGELPVTERPFGLVRVDPVARKVVRDYDVKGKSPHMVIPTPDGEWAYASDTDSDAVAAVRLKTGETTLIPTGKRPQGGVLSPDARRLYIANTDGIVKFPYHDGDTEITAVPATA